MGVSEAQLDRILAHLQTLAPGVDPAAGLRRDVPGLRILSCDGADLQGEIPYRRVPGFDLYLIDAQRHCTELVDDPKRASGVVLSRHTGGGTVRGASA